jgi:hypothetical protein
MLWAEMMCDIILFKQCYLEVWMLMHCDVVLLLAGLSREAGEEQRSGQLRS